MNRTFLTKTLGSLAGLIQGDTLTRDRWLWLKRRLPVTANGEKLLDVGCGSGAFTICAAQRGYAGTGLSWDEANMNIALERAKICGVANVKFQICDVRQLDQQKALVGAFDVAICCENIEHIIDDRRLIRAIDGCLKPGGRLFLTTPNYYYRAMTKEDNGPFLLREDGGHVRRGYTEAQIRELFAGTNLEVEQISYCSGFASQKLTAVLRQFRGGSYLAGWLLTLPFRFLVPPFDWVFHRLYDYPQFSICVEVYKRRF